jgi:hypothetical protein
MELSTLKGEKEQSEQRRRQELHRHRVFQQQQLQLQQQAAQQQQQQIQQQVQHPTQQQAQPPSQQIAQQTQQQQAQPQHQPQPGLTLASNLPQIRTQVAISQQQQQPRNQNQNPMSPQTLHATQQRLMLAQAQAQNQAHAATQGQSNMVQIANQINGTAQHLSTPFVNQNGSVSPVPTPHTSPPRASATPVNPATAVASNFQQRPPSAQRNAGIPGTNVVQMNGQVPIARTSSAMANLAYLQNNLPNNYTPEQMARLLNLQQQQHFVSDYI